MTVLVRDPTKILYGVVIEMEALGWVADAIAGPTRTIGHVIDLDVAYRIQPSIHVAVREISKNVARIRLVEDVEESGAELNLLALSDNEVLEERHIVIPAMR